MRYRPEQHLRRQGDIRALREQGRRVDCGAFTLWWLERPQDAATEDLVGPRVCVVASIAAVGKAIHRTRAKRRLRELFRIHQSRIAPQLDLMLLAKSGAVRHEFKEMERRFLQALVRLPALPGQSGAARVAAVSKAEPAAGETTRGMEGTGAKA